MKMFLIVEYKSGAPVWTDGKTYDNREFANSAMDYYHKFQKRGASLKVITLDMNKTRNVA